MWATLSSDEESGCQAVFSHIVWWCVNFLPRMAEVLKLCQWQTFLQFMCWICMYFHIHSKPCRTSNSRMVQTVLRQQATLIVWWREQKEHCTDRKFNLLKYWYVDLVQISRTLLGLKRLSWMGCIIDQSSRGIDKNEQIQGVGGGIN